MSILRAAGLSLSNFDKTLPVIGYANNVLPTNVTGTNEADGFNAYNLANPATHLRWKPTTNTGDALLACSGQSSQTVNYLAIARHNLGTLGCTVSVETGTSTVLVSTSVLTTNDPVIFEFNPTTGVDTYRLRINGGSGNPLRQVAVMYVGLLLRLERGVKVDVEHEPINLGQRTETLNGYSESGQFVGRVVRNDYLTTKAEFAWFTNAWYRANFVPFIQAASRAPFFFAWAPNEYPTDVGYAWTTKDIQALENIPTRRFMATIEMNAIAAIPDTHAFA